MYNQSYYGWNIEIIHIKQTEILNKGILNNFSKISIALKDIQITKHDLIT